MATRLAYRLFGRLPRSAKEFANRRLNDRFLVGVIGVVTNERSELLVLRHTYRPAFPWGLASGWLKRGEPVEGSLKREIKEETGYDVEFRRLLRIDNDRRAGRLDVWLEYELTGGEFRPSSEVSEARWCAADELPEGMPGVQRGFIIEHARAPRAPAGRAASEPVAGESPS